MRKPLIQHALLLELLSYDAATGLFHWKKSPGGIGAWVNKKAGSVRKNGYVQIAVQHRMYLAHRLAWFYVHGTWPAHQIDHINGVPSDNRLSNLREATPGQNMQNIRKVRIDSSSGVTGVSWLARDQRWIASIHREGKKTVLGYFKDKDEAIRARAEAKKVAHPFCVEAVA